MRTLRLAAATARLASFLVPLATLPVQGLAAPRTLALVGTTPVPGAAVAAAVSPDGKHVYVGGDPLYVTILERDAGTGALRFLDRAFINAQEVGSIVVSPDGAHVYVGTGPHGPIVTFARDAGTGALSGPVGFTLAEGRVMVITPDGAYLYVAGEYQLRVYARNAGTGALTLVDMESDDVVGGSSDGLALVNGLAISPDGAHVYTAASQEPGIGIFSRNAGTGEVTFVQEVLDGVGGVDGLRYATDVKVSPDGAHVYATGAFDDAVAVFSRNAGTGALTFVEVQRDGVAGVDGLAEPQAIALSLDGSHVYVASVADGAVAVFGRNPVTGVLTFLDAEREGAVGGGRLTFSPDGANLYVMSGGTIAALVRDPGTGLLSSVNAVSRATFGAAIAPSPDGGHVYMTNGAFGNGAIATFTRDDATGSLTFVETVVDDAAGANGLDGARGIVVSPDGAHVYVAAEAEDAVASFARDGGTGRLTFLGAERDGVGGVDGLDGARALALSPAGDHLYVASNNDDAVAVFARDAGSGALTLVEVERDGVGGVDGLDGARDVVVSPDGAHVYVAGSGDGAIAIFTRNPGTGALTYAGLAPVAVNSLAISADGAQVYAHFATIGTGSLTVFVRNAATGALTQRQTFVDGDEGLLGLAFNGALAASPDNVHVYLNSLVFARIPPSDELRFVYATFAGGAGVAVSPDLRHVYYSSQYVFAVAFGGCDPTPLATCRAAGRSSIRVGPAQPILTWRWARGAATSKVDFGDPTVGTHYAICVYDESQPAPSVAFRALAPAGGFGLEFRPLWRPKQNGFVYMDHFGDPEGLASMQLKAGTAGKAAVTVKAGGADMVPPALPLGLPLRVQVQSSSGECWEATYSTATKNDATGFRARSE